jgi:hypothetical protein
MGFAFVPFTSPEEKVRLEQKLKAKKTERTTRPKSYRPPVTPNFSSGRRRSWKRDEFGFDKPEID